jgi:hypothetical protein
MVQECIINTSIDQSTAVLYHLLQLVFVNSVRYSELCGVTAVKSRVCTILMYVPCVLMYVPCICTMRFDVCTVHLYRLFWCMYHTEDAGGSSLRSAVTT